MKQKKTLTSNNNIDPSNIKLQNYDKKMKNEFKKFAIDWRFK